MTSVIKSANSALNSTSIVTVAVKLPQISKWLRCVNKQDSSLYFTIILILYGIY